MHPYVEFRKPTVVYHEITTLLYPSICPITNLIERYTYGLNIVTVSSIEKDMWYYTEERPFEGSNGIFYNAQGRISNDVQHVDDIAGMVMMIPGSDEKICVCLSKERIASDANIISLRDDFVYITRNGIKVTVKEELTGINGFIYRFVGSNGIKYDRSGYTDIIKESPHDILGYYRHKETLGESFR